ncbi:MAG TPA: MFS transporter [Anaerolineaceae bacterium]
MDIISPDIKKDLVHNYIYNVLDGAFFGFAIGFASFSAVIPLFVARMTDSSILIGLISGIHTMGWQLPQLLFARHTSQLTRYKPTVVWLTIQERLPFLGLALIAWSLPYIGNTAALVLTYVMLIWQGLGAGFTANPWQNMIGKVFPPNYVATFYGMQSAAANLLSSGGAITAGYLLERLPYPNNFAACFLIACVWMIVSWLAINQTRESPHTITDEMRNPPNLWSGTLAILRKDKTFTWFLIFKMTSQFSSMAFAFYTVYANKALGMGIAEVGILSSVLMITQVISNPILGRIADRWSRKAMLVAGGFAAMLSAMLALIAPTKTLMYPAIILAGIANTSFWVIAMAFVLEFGNDLERPMYVGMANTLIAPATIIAPIIGGWLADLGGYHSMFAFAASAGLVTGLGFLFAVHDQRRP